MDSNISIRKAKITDLPVIVSILNDIIIEGGHTADVSPYTVDEKKNWFVQSSTAPLFIQVISINNNIVGYVYLSAWRNGRGALKHVAEISYFIAKSHRGKGYGRLALKHGIDLAWENNFKSLLAILMDTNIASINLLKSEGFHVAGRLPDVASFGDEVVGQYIMLFQMPSYG